MNNIIRKKLYKELKDSWENEITKGSDLGKKSNKGKAEPKKSERKGKTVLDENKKDGE